DEAIAWMDEHMPNITEIL
ncbi:DUF2552 domain-containing protein, partial [Parageobacillus sp. SY1]